MNKTDYIKILDSNRFSINEKKIFFLGIISDTIFDTKLFKSNSDIKEYVTLYLNIFKVDPYKDYLYESRTLLNSRVIRDFIKIEDTFSIKECFYLHKTFINSKKELSTKKRTESMKQKQTNLLEDVINMKGKLND